MRFKINKRARFNTSMLAGACIIALAVWGWGLPITTVFIFFGICFGFLALIVGLAALIGWVLSRLRKNDLE